MLHVEDRMFFKVSVLFAFISLFKIGLSENVPSLLTTNASIAVVIDREFLAEDYDDVRIEIEDYLIYARRELLKHGGVIVYPYSWTTINVRKDLTAILSIASCYDTWKLFKLTQSDDLVHMAITESDCPRLPPETAITIPLISNGEELPQIILDLRGAGIYTWKTLVLIYDSTVNRDMITRVIKSITQRKTSNTKATGVSLMKLDSNMSRIDVRTKLSGISPEIFGNNYLVIASYYLIGIIMEYAKSLSLTSISNQWLYVISDTNGDFHDLEVFENLLREGDNVAFLYNSSFTDNACVGGRKCHIEELLKSFTKSLDQAILEEFDTAGQVSEEEWEAIRPTKSERRDFLLKNMKSYLLKNGVCDNCTHWKISTGETWGVEYQTIGRKSVPKLQSVGVWRPSDGTEMTDELFLHIAHGFRGKTLPMITFHNPPWQILKFNESGDVVEYSGLIFDIVTELSKNLNFTFNLEIVNKSNTNNLTGGLSEVENDLTNKVPNTLLELLKNKTVALGACAVTITEDLKAEVNFTKPITILSYTFLVARPKELSRALLFISPFTLDTWVGLAASIVSMGPLLYFIHRYSPVYEYKGIFMKGGLASIQNCIWYMYGALLQQGGMHLPYADSARILVGAWWLVVLVMATTYCGNLVAFLTFPKIDIPITNLEQLIVHRDTISWSFKEGGFLEKELKDSDESRFQTILKGKSKYISTDVNVLIDSIEKGKHVYIDWKIKLQFLMKQQFLKTGRCDFVLGLEEFFDEKLALMIAPDSPYLLKINEEIKKLQQVGLIQKWLKDYLPKKDRCWKNRHLIEVNNHTVNLDDMQGSFFVLLMVVTSAPSEDKTWLYHHSEPWSVVEEKWKATSNERKAECINCDQNNTTSLLGEWPACRKENGQRLIDIDFDLQFPGKINKLHEKWEDFVIKIVPHFKSKIKDKQSLELLKRLDNEDVNIEARDILVFKLLHSKDKSRKWKFSISDSRRFSTRDFW